MPRIVIFSFFMALCMFGASGYPCTFIFAGVYYDASPLANSTDYTFSTQGNQYWINMCRPVVNTLCGTNSAACQQWDPNTANGHASLGAATTVQFSPARIPGEGGEGFTATFTDGDIPPGGNVPRSMEIDFACDPEAGTGMPQYEGEIPQLHFNFLWRSKYACSANGPNNCGIYGSCLNCAAGSCLWCLDSSSCIEMAVTNVSCNSWVGNPQYCRAEKCSSLSNCGGCAALHGCGWCLDTNSCLDLPVNSSTCLDFVTSPTYCPSTPDAKLVKAVIN